MGRANFDGSCIVVIYMDGVCETGSANPSVLSNTNLVALDRLATLGCSGLLMCRRVSNNDQNLSYSRLSNFLTPCNVPMIFLSPSSHACDAATQCGVTTSCLSGLDNFTGALDGDPGLVSSKVLEETLGHLGLVEGVGSIAHQEIVIVHLPVPTGCSYAQKQQVACVADGILSGLQPFERQVYVCVVSCDGDAGGQLSSDLAPTVSTPYPFRPAQSFLFSSGEYINEAELIGTPMYVTHYHCGTTRRDTVGEYTEEQLQRYGCNGSILASRTLLELCFKLGREPKYGA